MPINTLEGIKEAITNWWMWVFPGIIYFFYLVSKWQKFVFSMFIIHILISFYVGYITGIFVWPDVPFRDWIISLSGLWSISIFWLLVNKSQMIVEKYLNVIKEESKESKTNEK